MQDYDALRARVEETARRMKEAQAKRSERNHSLVEILGQLEKKFADQQEELNFYKSRIEPLEQSNEQLSALIARLLDMMNPGFTEDNIEPLRRASAMAARLLTQEVEARGEPAEPDSAAEDARYEDADPEALAQDAAMDDDDLESLPEAVRLALVDRQTEAFEKSVAAATAPKPRKKASKPTAGTVETVDALASALDQKSASGEPLEAGDIRALLDRVEALARESEDDGLEFADSDDDDIALFKDGGRRSKTGTEG